MYETINMKISINSPLVKINKPEVAENIIKFIISSLFTSKIKNFKKSRERRRARISSNS